MNANVRGDAPLARALRSRSSRTKDAVNNKISYLSRINNRRACTIEAVLLVEVAGLADWFGTTGSAHSVTATRDRL